MELGAWEPLLRRETEQPYFRALMDRVEREYRQSTVFPPRDRLFSAFLSTPPETVRVVILGQDPYHEPGQAHGLAFSVQTGTPLPPSLRNIFRELSDDQGVQRTDGCLSGWAEQGVLLLNSVLTVQAGNANAHARFGWQRFTDAAVSCIASLQQPVAFVLWGAQAQKAAASARASAAPRLVLCSPHPSPLSAYRGFFGSRPFGKVNEFLLANGSSPIDWSK